MAASRRPDLLTRNVLNGQLMMAPGRQGAVVLLIDWGQGERGGYKVGLLPLVAFITLPVPVRLAATGNPTLVDFIN